jgi:hypothetical protein
MAKNGLPVDFSLTSAANGPACLGSQRRESAINCSRSLRVRGASTMFCNFAPAWCMVSSFAHQRMCGGHFVVAIGTINTRLLTSRCVNRSSMRSNGAASSHCRSSRNRASGCSRVNAPMNRREDKLEAALRVFGGSSGTGSWSPMMSFNSGTRSTPLARREARRATRRRDLPAPEWSDRDLAKARATAPPLCRPAHP